MRKEQAQSFLLGIDLGTSVLKAAVFDELTGAVVAHASKSIPIISNSDGASEQDPRDVLNVFKETMRDLRWRAGNAWPRIGGAGVAAQGGSTIIADRASGNPLTPMYLWNDTRGYRHASELAKRKPKSFWRDHGLGDFPPMGLGRLAWLSEQQPRLFTDANIHCGAGEFLFFHLTGIWRQDAGHATQINTYNNKTSKLAVAPLALVGLPFSFVAPLRNGHEVAPLSEQAARWLKLPGGLPVAGPYIDQEAGYLSAMGGGGHPLHCSLGTAWVGNFVLPSAVKGSSPFRLVLPPPANRGRLIVQPLLTGNVTWDWCLDNLLEAGGNKFIRAQAIFDEALLPPEGLVALPWFNQRNLFADTHGAGAFFGLNPRTSRADMVRAVAAGMACELARVFSAVVESGAVDMLVLGGGASRACFFRELIAALVAPLPVHWQVDEDLSAARGSTYAFSAATARAKTERVPEPDQGAIVRARSLYKNYVAAFDLFFSGVPESGPFKIQRKKVIRHCEPGEAISPHLRNRRPQ